MIKQFGITDIDFLIKITPQLDGTEWNGAVDVSIIHSPDNPLDDDSFANLTMIANMMAAALPVMEENDGIRDHLFQYVSEMEIEDDYEQDNVVSLDMFTKTRGNA